MTWAWSEQRSRWAPIEPDSVSGDEREIEDDYGRPAPVIEGWHRYHSCLKKKTAKVDPVAAAYATLHLATSAPEAVIKAAHRALSLMHHPDRGGDLEQMKRVNAAYDLLAKGG